jgi:hypothetical protein
MVRISCMDSLNNYYNVCRVWSSYDVFYGDREAEFFCQSAPRLLLRLEKIRIRRNPNWGITLALSKVNLIHQILNIEKLLKGRLKKLGDKKTPKCFLPMDSMSNSHMTILFASSFWFDACSYYFLFFSNFEFTDVMYFVITLFRLRKIEVGPLTIPKNIIGIFSILKNTPLIKRTVSFRSKEEKVTISMWFIIYSRFNGYFLDSCGSSAKANPRATFRNVNRRTSN